MSEDNYHVTSVLNRESIKKYGLDWRRMGLAPGIAGSREPEVDGCFIARGRYECRLFTRMNNTGGCVDVWKIDGIDISELHTSKHGYLYYPGTIAADQLSLEKCDVPPATEVNFIDEC